jgi:hypothetical protein
MYIWRGGWRNVLCEVFLEEGWSGWRRLVWRKGVSWEGDMEGINNRERYGGRAGLEEGLVWRKFWQKVGLKEGGSGGREI